MFLHITEFGDIFKSEEIPEGVLKGCDDGIWDIFDITDPENPKQYLSGVWIDIKEIDNE